MDVEAVKRLIERRPNLSTALGMDLSLRQRTIYARQR